MLKFLIPVLGLVLAGMWLPGAAHAIPPSVMEPYRAYMAAIEADDLEAAAPHAEEAWQAGVAAGIDDETLAALAENRAQLYSDIEEHARAGAAWDATVEVLRRTGADGDALSSAMHNAALSYFMASRMTEARQRADAYLAEIGDAGPDAHLYTIHNIRAQSLWDAGRTRQAGAAAVEALDMLERIGPSVTQRTMALAKLAAVGRSLTRDTQSMAFYLTLSTEISEALGWADSQHEAMDAWLRYLRRNMTDREREDLFERVMASALFDFEFEYPESEPPEDDGLDGVEVQIALPQDRRPPSYPYDAMQAGAEGTAMVQFDVSATGRPENIEVIFSVPYSTFGRAAVNAVRRWRYTPRTEDGQPVAERGLQTMFEFTIQ
ncbi:energy transducer TonB [Glycocaulis abyssi]